MKKILLCVVLLTIPTASYAKYFTPELLSEYLNSGECEKRNQAAGYIVGVYDSFEGVIYMHHEGLKREDLVDVVDRFMKQNKEGVYYSAQLMVLRAIEDYVKKQEEEKRRNSQ